MKQIKWLKTLSSSKIISSSSNKNNEKSHSKAATYS